MQVLTSGSRASYRRPSQAFEIVLNLASIGFDCPVGTYTLASLIVIIPLMVLGWFACRTNIRRIAAERQGYTGLSPVVADRQVIEYFKSR